MIKWGIIGCGDVTEKKSGPAFSKIESSSLTAVMRRNGEKAKDYAERHGVPLWFDDANELIHHPEVNAIYIATPPDTHASYAIQALEAGKPVYVEKPMARNFEECQQMLAAAKQADQHLLVAYYRRSLPAFLQVKEWLDEKAIGEIRMVNLRLLMPPKADETRGEPLPWRVIPEIAGGGHFMDLAAHQLDFLDYILGPIKTVHGIAKNQAGFYPAEDAVVSSFQFENGILGTGYWGFTFTPEQKTDIIELEGTNGRISFSCFSNTPVSLRSNEREEQIEVVHPETIQEPMIQQVVGHLLGKGNSPSTGESAARTNWVMDQILHSYYH